MLLVVLGAAVLHRASVVPSILKKVVVASYRPALAGEAKRKRRKKSTNREENKKERMTSNNYLFSQIGETKNGVGAEQEKTLMWGLGFGVVWELRHV